MTGKSYAYAMTQLEIQLVFHPDAHMFAQENFYKAKLDVVITIMTPFSLN